MQKSVRRRFPGFGVIAVMVATLATTISAYAETVRVNGTISNGSARLSFNWPASVGFHVDATDDRLIVRFDRPIEADYADASDRLGAYLGPAEPAADGLSVSFPLKRKVVVVSSAADDTVLVDLLHTAADRPDDTPPEPPTGPKAPPKENPKPRTTAIATVKPAASPGAGASKPAAETQPPVLVRTGEHEGYSRVVFDWPKQVGYRVERNGDTASVAFDRPAAFDLSRINRRPPRYASDAQTHATGTGAIVTLAVAETSKIRDLRVGPKVVIDVMAPYATPKTAISHRPEKKPAEVTKSEDKSNRSADIGDTAQSTASSDTPPTVTAETPRAEAEAPAAEMKAAETPESSDASPAPEQPAEQAEQVTERPESNAAPASGILRFDWNRPVAATVFRRADRLWTVFDAPSKQDLQALRLSAGSLVQDIEQIAVTDATVLSMATSEGTTPTVHRQGLAWIVKLSGESSPARVAIESRSEIDYPAGARVFLPIPEPGQPITFSDPRIGDTVIVVPVIPLGHGIARTHSYPEFELPPTAQGIVVLPEIDDLRVRSLRSGVEITTEGGLIISAVPEEIKEAARRNTIRDISQVSGLEDTVETDIASFAQQEEMLEDQIAGSVGVAQEQARFRLARFYLAMTHSAESLGVLGLIAEHRPEVTEEARFRVLRGAGRLLMGRAADAREDLFHQSLDDVDEGLLWRSLANVAEQQPLQPLDDLERLLAIGAAYPMPLRNTVNLSLLEAAIVDDRSAEVSDLMDTLRTDLTTPHERGRLSYLEGRSLQAGGDVEGALAKWEETIALGDRLSTARATVARTDQLLALARISRKDAIDALEQVRFTWRGDRLEFDLLRRLGDLHIEEGNFLAALRSFKQAATHFHDVADTSEVTRHMTETFERLFTEGEADALPPFAAIALFNEFRELTPTGARGNAMVRRLAERLLDVDLLEPAAALLEDQLRYRTSDTEKAETGARLAHTHLLDRNPDSALAALDESAATGLSEDLRSQRQRLQARALAQLGREKEALAALDGDDSREADRIRGEVHWSLEQWDEAARALGRAVGAFENRPRSSLDETEARPVLDLAIALTLAGHERALARVQQEFGMAMDKTAYREPFRIIAGMSSSSGAAHRAAADKVKDAEKFLDYLAARAN